MNLIEVINDHQHVWVEIGQQIVQASDPMKAQECWASMTEALAPVFAEHNSADVSAAVAVYIAYIAFELAKEVKVTETQENVHPSICLMAIANMANSNLAYRKEEDHGEEESSEEESEEEGGEESN